MRINLSNAEATALLSLLAPPKRPNVITLVNEEHPQFKSVVKKLQAAMSNQAERDEFKVGDVTCKRVRGDAFKGRDRRTTSSKHFGWVLTHEPTGCLYDLPPDRNKGITKRSAKRFAEQFQKTCEIASKA